MARITLDLLRRRAEHNEGCLTNLKEVALHQQDIEKIELIGDCCRQLEILYLCNNYIAVIEGLQHLKHLKYLNLAVNNITSIAGLEGCESLQRLDLTLNFIADVTCVERLQANAALEELHLTGNPCTKAVGYRGYVIHVLPQIKELDGQEVIRAERIVARQEEDSVTEQIEDVAMRAREAERIKREMLAQGIDPFPPRYNDKGERLYGHTPEERLQMLREQQEKDEARRRAQDTPQPGSLAALHQELTRKPERLTPEEEMAKYGRLLMRNEAKIPFTLQQDRDDEVVVTVEPGKFLATSLLNVQVDVGCIRVYIKDKLLQLPTDRELRPSAATVQRSTTTGQLKITIPVAEQDKGGQRGLRTRLASLGTKPSHCAATTSSAQSQVLQQKTAGTMPLTSSVACVAAPPRTLPLTTEECHANCDKVSEPPAFASAGENGVLVKLGSGVDDEQLYATEREAAAAQRMEEVD